MMNYEDYLSETPVISLVPCNVVEMRLRDGKVKTLFVDNRRLAPPVAGGPMSSIEEAVQAYMRNHPEVEEGQVYTIQESGERHYVKTVTAAE